MFVNKQQMVLWMETKSLGEPSIRQKEQEGKKRIRNRSVSGLREDPTRLLSKFVPGESLWREAATTGRRSLKAHPSPAGLPGSCTNRGCAVLDETRAHASSPMLDALQITVSSWKHHYFCTPPDRKHYLARTNKTAATTETWDELCSLVAIEFPPCGARRLDGKGENCFSSRGWGTHTLYVLSSLAENLPTSSSLSFDVHPKMGQFPSSLHRQ